VTGRFRFSFFSNGEEAHTRDKQGKGSTAVKNSIKIRSNLVTITPIYLFAFHAMPASRERSSSLLTRATLWALTVAALVLSIKGKGVEAVRENTHKTIQTDHMREAEERVQQRYS
jgi:hypothetical protein